MELKDQTLAFSRLIGTPVVSGGGKRLGRVFEVRAHPAGDGSIVLDELLVGRGGLLKRLRGPSAEARGIAWESVAEVGPNRILVNA
jgi:hypothetical protein